jgi:uncharacterized repeat protein (TIGR01451 family)
MSLRKLSLLVFLVACNADDMTSQQAPADFGGGTDVFAGAPIDPAKVAALREHAKTFVKPGTQLQVEPRLGVPTFVWMKEPLTITPRARWVAQGVKRPEVSAAQTAVRNLAPLYNLADADVTQAVVAHVATRPNGPSIVKLHTQVGGIEIFREELNVILDRNLDPVALSGYISSFSTPPARTGAMDFALTPEQAIARTVAFQAKQPLDAALVQSIARRDGYDFYQLAQTAGVELADPIRVKKYYFHMPTGLEAAYYVELSALTGTPPVDRPRIDGSKVLESYGYVVSAATGQLLTRKNFIQEETYRVWADPVTKIPHDTPSGTADHPKVIPLPDGTQAPFVAPSDVTLANFPFSHNDPWLPPGATETVGNNVDAFVDIVSGPNGNVNDGYGPPTTTTPTDLGAQDYRAQLTGAGAFLHTQVPDVASGTAEARQAAIQQLFYNINFLHDWYYDAGFNEAAGNAQTNNFSRGGLGNDNIRGEAQDTSGVFNANMQTPADGARPRMQMFMFSHPGDHLEVIGVGKASLGTAFLGPQAFDINAEIVPATFTGCTVTNAAALAGKLALLDFNFAGCAFVNQFAAIEASTTALGSVMQYQSGANANVTPVFTGFLAGFTKPITFISFNNGQAIRGMAAPVNVRLKKLAARDGSLDQQIVAHEWMHYMSNRLVNNANGLTSLQGSGMGEGWGDTSAMLLTVRAEDTAVPSNSTWNGVYPLATHAVGGAPFDGSANESAYFGIRRYPYSTDMTKNPLTFKHIQDGVALPVGPPVLFGADGADNSEVHNTGEVWAQMLWECYAGILRDTQGSTPRLTFQEAQDRMKAYLVGGLKATTAAPTILEARDALLAFMMASDSADYVACKTAFAKRGAGRNAIGPDRFSPDNTPVTEDFNVGPELEIVGVTFDDTLGSCDDDGVVDHGEYGKVTVTVRNTGVTTFTGTALAVGTTSAGMWFPSGTQANFPSIGVGETKSASVQVALPPTSTGIQQVDFQLAITDADLAGPINRIATFRVDTDDVLASSATDSVEPTTTLWTTDFNPLLHDVAPWTRQFVTPTDREWHVDDADKGSDQRLVSPPLTVSAAGTFTVKFDHQWAFEADAGGNYDGGVVEISINNAAFVDFGSAATAGGYNGPLIAYSGNPNPLAGRQAFVGTSAGVVTTTLTQTIPAGSTVRVRFRAGSDLGVGAAGWNIDNIEFQGIDGTPFATVVQDPDACAVVPTSADLSVIKNDGLAFVSPGDALTYTIVASNAGPGDIIGATVADALPADLTCTWTCAGSSGGVCGSPSGSGSILDKPTLPSGGSTTYTASCTLSTTTALFSISNTATIANPGPVTDPNPGNNSSTDTDAIIRAPAHLTGTKTVAGTFDQGDTVTYTVILNNDATGKQFDNAGDEFTDVLPAGLTLVSASATSGTAAATVVTNTVTWNGAIDAGGNVTITIVATINAPAGTTISNQGSFVYDGDGNGTNETPGVTDAFPCP